MSSDNEVDDKPWWQDAWDATTDAAGSAVDWTQETVASGAATLNAGVNWAVQQGVEVVEAGEELVQDATDATVGLAQDTMAAAEEMVTDAILDNDFVRETTALFSDKAAAVNDLINDYPASEETLQMLESNPGLQQSLSQFAGSGGGNTSITETLENLGQIAAANGGNEFFTEVNKLLANEELVNKLSDFAATPEGQALFQGGNEGPAGGDGQFLDILKEVNADPQQTLDTLSQYSHLSEKYGPAFSDTVGALMADPALRQSLSQLTGTSAEGDGGVIPSPEMLQELEQFADANGGQQFFSEINTFMGNPAAMDLLKTVAASPVAASFLQLDTGGAEIADGGSPLFDAVKMLNQAIAEDPNAEAHLTSITNSLEKIGAADGFAALAGNENLQGLFDSALNPESFSLAQTAATLDNVGDMLDASEGQLFVQLNTIANADGFTEFMQANPQLAATLQGALSGGAGPDGTNGIDPEAGADLINTLHAQVDAHPGFFNTVTTMQQQFPDLFQGEGMLTQLGQDPAALQKVETMMVTAGALTDLMNNPEYGEDVQQFITNLGELGLGEELQQALAGGMAGGSAESTSFLDTLKGRLDENPELLGMLNSAMEGANESQQEGFKNHFTQILEAAGNGDKDALDHSMAQLQQYTMGVSIGNSFIGQMLGPMLGSLLGFLEGVPILGDLVQQFAGPAFKDGLERGQPPATPESVAAGRDLGSVFEQNVGAVASLVGAVLTSEEQRERLLDVAMAPEGEFREKLAAFENSLTDEQREAYNHLSAEVSSEMGRLDIGESPQEAVVDQLQAEVTAHLEVTGEASDVPADVASFVAGLPPETVEKIEELEGLQRGAFQDKRQEILDSLEPDQQAQWDNLEGRFIDGRGPGQGFAEVLNKAIDGVEAERQQHVAAIKNSDHLNIVSNNNGSLTSSLGRTGMASAPDGQQIALGQPTPEGGQQSTVTSQNDLNDPSNPFKPPNPNNAFN